MLFCWVVQTVSALIYQTNTDLFELDEKTLQVMEAAEHAIHHLFRLDTPSKFSDIPKLPRFAIRNGESEVGEVEFRGGQVMSMVKNTRLVFWAYLNPRKYAAYPEQYDPRWLQTMHSHSWMRSAKGLPCLRDGPKGKLYYGIELTFDIPKKGDIITTM